MEGEAQTRRIRILNQTDIVQIPRRVWLILRSLNSSTCATVDDPFQNNGVNGEGSH